MKVSDLCELPVSGFVRAGCVNPDDSPKEDVPSSFRAYTPPYLTSQCLVISELLVVSDGDNQISAEFACCTHDVSMCMC